MQNIHFASALILTTTVAIAGCASNTPSAAYDKTPDWYGAKQAQAYGAFAQLRREMSAFCVDQTKQAPADIAFVAPELAQPKDGPAIPMDVHPTRIRALHVFSAKGTGEEHLQSGDLILSFNGESIKYPDPNDTKSKPSLTAVRSDYRKRLPRLQKAIKNGAELEVERGGETLLVTAPTENRCTWTLSLNGDKHLIASYKNDVVVNRTFVNLIEEAQLYLLAHEAAHRLLGHYDDHDKRIFARESTEGWGTALLSAGIGAATGTYIPIDGNTTFDLEYAVVSEESEIEADLMIEDLFGEGFSWARYQGVWEYIESLPSQNAYIAAHQYYQPRKRNLDQKVEETKDVKGTPTTTTLSI